MTESEPILRRTVSARLISVNSNSFNSEIELFGAVSLDHQGDVVRQYLSFPQPTNAPFPRLKSETLWARNVSGSLIANVRRVGGKFTQLPFEDCSENVALDQLEHELFSDRNVLLGTSNGEDVAVWRDWLLWHRQRHSADAALILDRGTPASVKARASEFAKLLKRDARSGGVLQLMQIVVLGVDCPLGRRDLGHEADPFNAPDAPGKSRMGKPDPDPWHSPLSFRLIYDLLNWRFLRKAKAVLNLQVNELAVLNDHGSSVFETTAQSSTGAIALVGQRSYPWGLKNEIEPGFGDHICTCFDVASRETRWCVSPAQLPAEAIWMPTRILGVTAERTDFSFWRFMGLRHCRPEGAGVGQIVPKSSLIENAGLLEISKHFGADPRRQPHFPQDGFEDHKTKTGSEDRVAIVTTMKNEGPFILEWIAYHRAIGVDDFLVYTNDCTDGTDELLRLLDRKGFCHWRDNPYRKTKMKPQHAALRAAGNEKVVEQASWLICMDVDEYIAIHTGDGTLAALFDAAPEANMISLTWRLFGNSDISSFREGFVTQNFTRAAHEFANKPHVAWGFKTLFRNNGNFKKMGVHRPKGIKPKAVERINWVNGSGKPMPKNQWRNAWRSNKVTYGYELASLNHYAVRSAESFLVKRDRGRVNHVDRDQGLAYWFRMNHNVVEDDRMRRMLPKLTAEYDALLADPDIKAAHNACVEAHQRKIEALKKQPKYKAFFEMLISDRMRKLSRLHGHFGTNVYLSGPSVIPEELVERDPDEEFFFTVEHAGEAQH